MTPVLQLLAGLVVVAFLVRRARRTAARERLSRLGVRPRVVDRLGGGGLRWRAMRSRPQLKRRGRRGRRRSAALARELPAAVELVRMGVGAGLTPADALAVVAASRLGPSRALAALVAADVGAGLTLREAGRRRAAATGDAGVARLLSLLSDGQRSGAPLGHTLGVLATDLRTAQRRRAEERARAVPVKLLFPLVFLALPAFVLLTVAPAVLVAFGR